MSDQPFQAPSPEYLAGLLSNYDIESFIAQGGMGAVYKARQISLDRDVAIKILPRELGEDPEFRESFESEAKAMARLNHPNLLGIFDFGSAEGMPYIVMEYVHGQSLHDSAGNQAIDPSQAVAIVKGICNGLAHAHGNGIVHRDIKPSNILLTQMAEPKIGDFGLAHAADSDQPGLVMGTPGYTAPEVFHDPSQAGPLADIYSVGVILHQLLTGIDPAGVMEPPTQVTGDPGLDAIWRKATQTNPALRYPSIAAMGADLEDRATSKSTAHLPSRPVPPARRSRQVRVKRASGIWGILKLVTICILVATIVYFYRNRQERKVVIVVSNADSSEANQVKPSETAADPAPTEPVAPDPEPNPEPNPKPVETATRDEPTPSPVIEPKPEEKPVIDLPPGDPDLQTRAIGLIADARKKRDKDLAGNVRSLLTDLADRARSAKSDDVARIERFKKEIADNRIPIIDDVQAFGDGFAAPLNQADTNQEAIDATHRYELTKIRDAYVTRLKGAATETTDEDLKRRLLAQADRASELDAWIRLLAPEGETPPERFFGVGFAGKWNVSDSGKTDLWIAHPDGKVEFANAKWTAEWVLLEDGSLEVRFADKKPYKFTRDGKGWTGKTSFGRPAALTRSD